jgi:hypothetical protein
MMGRRVGDAIFVAVKLGIPDLLQSGEWRTVRELAQASDTQPEPLNRLLRALASVGLISHDPERQSFALTSLGETLRKSSQGSLRAQALYFQGGEFREAWGNLEYSIRTGRTAFDHLFGMSAWEFMRRNPQREILFDESMSSTVKLISKGFSESYSFTEISKLVDVGGGNGSLLITVLKKHTHLLGLVVDQIGVIDRAKEKIAEEGLTSRCDVLNADILTSIPSGGDAYVLSRIIHDWNDEKAVQILTNCSKAMESGQKVLMLERIVPSKIEKNKTSELTCFVDLSMMVMNGGKERTKEEFREILDLAGFRLERIVEVGNDWNVIEGIKR